MQCKMEISPVIQIWVHLMKKIRVSHFRQKGYLQMQMYGLFRRSLLPP